MNLKNFNNFFYLTYNKIYAIIYIAIENQAGQLYISQKKRLGMQS